MEFHGKKMFSCTLHKLNINIQSELKMIIHFPHESVPICLIINLFIMALIILFTHTLSCHMVFSENMNIIMKFCHMGHI